MLLQDAKAHRLFLTVPKPRRLFWAILSVWISVGLAVIAIVFVRGSSEALDVFASWFLLLVSPAAAMLCSFVLGNALHSFLESCSREARESAENVTVENVTVGFIVSRGRAALAGSMKRAKARFAGGDRCFYAVRTLWLAQGVISWWFLFLVWLFPVAFDVTPFQFDHGEDYESLPFTSNLPALVFAIAVLVAGLAMKAWDVCLPRRDRSAVLLDEPLSAQRTAAVRESCCGSCTDARVPSLLVGWGAGYWVTSLLYVLGGAWHGGGWSGAPLLVRIAGYVILPGFVLVGILVMADTKLLGERLGAIVKPALDTLKDKRRVWYWVLATVLRDVLLLWVLFSFVLVFFIVTTKNV